LERDTASCMELGLLEQSIPLLLVLLLLYFLILENFKTFWCKAPEYYYYSCY